MSAFSNARRYRVQIICVPRYVGFMIWFAYRYYDHKKQAARKEKKTVDASKMVLFLDIYRRDGESNDMHKL